MYGLNTVWIYLHGEGDGGRIEVCTVLRFPHRSGICKYIRQINRETVYSKCSHHLHVPIGKTLKTCIEG